MAETKISRDNGRGTFNKEKKKSTFVQNIPQILTQKKAENYNKLFNGLSEHDIDSMEI